MADEPKIKVRKGLVICYTGDGKGKTTAALGMALRASGYNLRTLIWQFIKGSWHYGELDAVARLAPYVDIRQMGEGFVGIVDDKLPREVHREAALKALAGVREEIVSGRWHLVVLDEVFVGCQLKFLTADDILQVIAAKPAGVHLILTGRGAPPEVLAAADLVTEMREIKHPYQQGELAQKGIDF
ncbi:MAG TPA: cob(I)yrinic acid a,c-diamide adenosyltransferase [Acidobacteriota bacterium]|nr:cob(I)yrinic acid a,c-diamide adenosyltransferase [Acidobacteriota bacterium]